MTFSDILMMPIRILSYSFYVSPKKVERANPTDDHGKSPMHVRRAEGVEDASESSVPQPTKPYCPPPHPAS